MSDCKERFNKLWTKLYKYEKRLNINDFDDIRSKFGDEIACSLNITLYDAELKNIFYIDEKPSLQFPNEVSKKKIYTHEEIVNLLKYVSFMTRDILKEWFPDIENESLIGQCMQASEIALLTLRRFNVDAYELRSERLFHTDINHSFVLAEFPTNDGVEAYIVDLTFRQFCLLSRCNPDRIYHFEYKSVFPGYYINSNIASQLLRDGFLPLTGENAKAYAESFRGNINNYNEERYIKCIQFGKKLR